jgi:hypothetical protein
MLFFPTNTLSVDVTQAAFRAPEYSLSRTGYPDSHQLLKRGIWLYLLLLLFEGALRKWILPGLATPLLIVRDPLALWLVVVAWKQGLLPPNRYLGGIIVIGILGVYTALLLGHGNIYVALYGARPMLLHFPLIFVIGRVFTRKDVVQVGRTILWISIPMVLLIGLQFFSPQSAWVNRGVNSDFTGAGLGGALGFFRPAGTFSFTNGNSQFFGLVASFTFFFWFSSDKINWRILAVATITLMAAIPFSISRTLFFQVLVSLLFAVVAVARKPKYVGKMIGATLAIGVAFAILTQTSFFQTATGAFTARFEDASDVEGGLQGTLIDRFLGGMLSALTQSTDMPLFGYGLGMGSNVGSMLLSGKRLFLIAEEEWGREIGELGPLLGLALIGLRVGLTAKMGIACYRKLAKSDLLPWLLFSFGLIPVLQGQWAQPTSLGFGIAIGGLILASLRGAATQE